MPQINKVQSGALPLSGVPASSQLAVPADAPAPQPPPAQAQPQVTVNQPQYNQAATQQVAGQRAADLTQQAENLYPETNSASILSTLAGVAGNIAGALTNHGDVGNPGVEYGQKLREDASNKQKQWIQRTLEGEQKYKEEQQQAIGLQNKQLRANSLVPLFNKMPDAEAKAALFTQMASGDIDGAEANYRHFQELQRQKENDLLTRQMKLQNMDFQQQRLGMQQTQNELNDQIKKITLAQKESDFANKPAIQQQKIVQQESRDYNKEVQKLRGPVADYVDIVQKLGGLDSDTAKEKLARILGMGGSIKGQYTGTAEDKSLFQLINRLYGTVKTEDFGSRFTEGENKLVAAGSGFALGGGLFGNALHNPDNVIQGLKAVQRELETKLDAAGANKQDKTLEGFEKGGNFLTLRTFTKALADANASGPVDLDKTPPGVSPSDWVQMNRATRAQFHRTIKTGGQ